MRTSCVASYEIAYSLCINRKLRGNIKIALRIELNWSNETNFTFACLNSPSTFQGPFELPVEWQTTRTVPRLPSNMTITFSALPRER